MRRLIADLYKIVYKKTKSKVVSLFSAIGYITTLNLITIYGVVILLEDWQPILSRGHILFRFPFIIATVAAMFSFNFWIMLPLHRLSEEVDIRPVKAPLVLYSLISGLLYAYALLTRHLI